jgi:site-specific DNA recombinase
MPSTNGHGPKRAVLYARVSTDEQARTGYSLAQQIEALRDYAARDGYEILEEVQDPGQSGASLERPGMDRVRDLVAVGGVSVVLAQDRDRIARKPAYNYLLEEEFAEHGCELTALNDYGDHSPEGALMRGIQDQLAEYERAKMAERTRRGKMRRAREGKVIPSRMPDYGFRYNAARDNYEVDEDVMPIVRRIFRMMAVEGIHINTIKKTFDREGLTPPNRGRFWDRGFIRECIKDDVYKPYTYEEIRELVAPEVAARLDPAKRYGIWWFNQRRVTRKQVSETSPDGRRYRRQSKYTFKPKAEWVAVPVPDAGIPRVWVEAAREAIKNNKVPSSAGRRFWELSGGIFRCGCCGRMMLTDSTLSPRAKSRHFYYRCPTRMQNGKHACPQRKHYRADQVEPEVWELVSGLLKDPERIRAGLDAMIERERKGLRGNPDREAAALLSSLAEADRMRGAYQDQQAAGLMTLDELGEKLVRLEEVRHAALRELEVVRSRKERVEALERDRDALLASYAGMVPEALDSLDPEERHRIYKMLRLKVATQPDGGVEVNGALGYNPVFRKLGAISA